MESDEALRNELSRLESSGSKWTHPMGFSLLSSLRIFNAPMDPVLNNTGYWIQPEDPEDIPAMFDSYLNVNCLYYSLVGVLAIETSLFFENPSPDSPPFAQWLLTVSRFCWAANGVWSMAAVVASFHILWCVHATPVWAKRRFVFDNSRTISIVYAMGAPNFVMMLVGTIAGTIGNALNQEHTNKDWIAPVAGLSIGLAVVVIFVLGSGSIITKCVRPWKVADENIRDRKKRWSEVGGAEDSFYQDVNTKEDPDGPLFLHDPSHAELDGMNMPFVAPKLIAAGLTLDLLRRARNEVLIDQILQGAGVDVAGDRLRVILYVRDSAPVEGKSVVVAE